MVSTQQGQSNTHVDMKIDSKTLDERTSALPLPEQPSATSDFNSADPSTVNVPKGDLASGINQASGNLNDAGVAGRQSKDGLGGLPNDAVSRDAKDKAGLSDTTK